MAVLNQIELPDGTSYDIKDNSQTYSDHRHYDSDTIPLIHKVYESTSYYGTTNDWSNTSWYFMSVKPDTWYKPWRVKLKVHTYCPAYSGYHSYTWSTICGRETSMIYANWNEKYNSAHSYFTFYPLKKAGFDAGYGHAIGVSIYNADSRTSSAYYRTFEIDYYECENCTVTILDTPVKWANWSGTGTTNYGSLASLDAITRGLRETGDDNTVSDNRITYFAGKTGNKGIWAASLFMEDANGTYQNICTASDGTVTANNRTTATTKIANTNGFKVGSTIYYTNTNYAANTGISGWGAVYSSISVFDTRYSMNTTLTAGSLTVYKPVYLVGTINATDGLYYLDTVWWTQTPTETGKIYVLIGGVYDSSTSYCRATLYEDNPWYYYDGSKLVRYLGDGDTTYTAGTGLTLSGTEFNVGKRWTAVTQGQKWSRIYLATPVTATIGTSGILSVACIRGSVVCNATFLVTSSHAGSDYANCIELASCNYTQVRSRLVAKNNSEYYFEIYDTAQSIASGTTQSWKCCFIPLTDTNLTMYTEFTDGTTIPSGYTAMNDFTTTAGSSASAIKNISRNGTTFTATRQNGSTFTFSQQDNNTTYTFANGTNGFTVTPSGGTAQTVTVTPSITNNITGSGTSGSLVKFNGTNTITNGPAIGSDTTKFLNNAGSWAVPPDTKVTSSTNHYTPATASGQDKTASASGATAAWSIDVIKGVTLNTDGKGHVTGLSVTSGKIPAKPSYSAADVGAIPTSSKGAANGVAELDANGLVPTSQLPSFVDDVLEYSSKSAFPATGETGKIYVALDTNLTYRWSGTAYVEISPSLALGETSSTAYRGDRGKIAYDHSQSTHARTDATAVSFTRNLTSGTKIGTITINGTGTNLYCETNTDTKNTAGSTDTSLKIFLIGATSQAANLQTYSDNEVYVTNGVLQTKNAQASAIVAANTANSSTQGGLSLYGTSPSDYGIAFRGTGNGGKHGYVQGDWAQYHYMAGADNRGWIFNAGASTGVASISKLGHAVFNGSVTVGGNSTNTSGCRLEYNSITQSLDFVFA